MAIKIKRKMMWIIISSIAILLIALSFTRFEIKKEVIIHAPPKKVWQTIIDFENYHRWNTQLEYLGGEVKPNGKLHLKLTVEGTAPYEFKPVISRWEENKSFAWLAITGIPRVFDGEHFFELKKEGEGKTRLINKEEYRGILSLVIKNLSMMKEAPKGFAKMNQELKNYAENEN